MDLGFGVQAYFVASLSIWDFGVLGVCHFVGLFLFFYDRMGIEDQKPVAEEHAMAEPTVIDPIHKVLEESFHIKISTLLCVCAKVQRFGFILLLSNSKVWFFLYFSSSFNCLCFWDFIFQHKCEVLPIQLTVDVEMSLFRCLVVYIFS